MDYLDVLLALSIFILMFCIGYLIGFLFKVRLGLKKNSFVCAQCGNCCRLRFIELNKEDIERIKSAGHKDFYDKIKNEFMLKRNKGRCVFLNNNDSCSIYEIRPQVCRDFPFFKTFGLTYCQTGSYCPGIEKLKKNV